MKDRKPRKWEPHVRLYGWELRTPAYQTLSPDARALLVEFRSLYKGTENRVFLSVRQMMKRLGVGQRRATNARDALLERGWIKVIELGGFSCKVRLATVYRLTNEPISSASGAATTKEYARWEPPLSEKNGG